MADKQYIDHPTPIQSYPKDQFVKLSAIPEGSKESGFERMGIHIVKVLTGEEETGELGPDDTLDLPKQPAAETAETAADQIKKEAVEMMEKGEENTPAESFTERSKEQASEAAEGIAEDQDPKVKDSDKKDDKAEKGAKAATKPTDGAK